ncbi:hypothetical protein DSO57_1014250 [Entomophthora muscae]|uniref:Uncharacterized protein n=1 Tax=Entomophthora muscae TaxID=34485 RepID=A0ACC2UFX0_9FUNG|nr:hypothetical protein DSO57_1014250 [Entomophthora muscae]
MRKLTYSDAANWDLYLPAALFAYCLSKHCITRYSLFAILYGQKAATPLLLGAPLITSDKAMNPDGHTLPMGHYLLD